MSRLVHEDFFKHGFFVKEELLPDERGTLKKYWFSRWYHGGHLVAEVTATVRLGFTARGEQAVRLEVAVKQGTKKRVWLLAAQPGCTLNLDVIDAPKYVRTWLMRHETSMVRWYHYLGQFHK